MESDPIHQKLKGAVLNNLSQIEELEGKAGEEGGYYDEEAAPEEGDEGEEQ